MNQQQQQNHHQDYNKSLDYSSPLLQEIEFWNDESKQANHPSYKKAAKEVYHLFKQHLYSIFEFMEGGNNVVCNATSDCTAVVDPSSSSNVISWSAFGLLSSPSQFFDFLERHFTDGNIVETTLLNIFQVMTSEDNYIYSASRMKNTIDLITESMCKLLRHTFPHQNQLLSMDSHTIKSLVIRSKDTMDSYLTMINRLRKIDFALRKHDPWVMTMQQAKEEGHAHNRYCCDKVDELMHRMESLYFIRATCDELEIILSREDLDSSNAMNLLKGSFEDFDPLDVFDEMTKPMLDDCLSLLDRTILPLESKIAESIQEEVEQLHSKHVNVPFLILATAEKYQHILKRKNVQSHLGLFLLQFRNTIKGILQSLQAAVEDDCFDENDRFQSIHKCRRIKRKVEKIRIGYSSLVSGSLTYKHANDEVLRQCLLLSDMCDDAENSLFNLWLEESKEKLKMFLRSLELKGIVIEFNNDSNQFKVTLDNDLAKLIDQERKMQLLGFDTKTMMNDAVIAKKYCKVGAFLNKIILFRNHVEQHISREELDLIKPILVEFDQFLIGNADRNKKPVSWSDEIECQRFATELFKIANKLRSEMDRISRLHENLTEKTCVLLNYDLLSQRSLWVRYMKDVEASFQNTKINSQSSWLTYWKNQIYKVFDASYSKGLVYLVNSIDQIQCEMILRKNSVEIIPSLSEIRTKMYEQIVTFAEYPIKYGSRCHDEKMFGSLPMMSEMAIGQTYMVCEACIKRLYHLLERYSQRIIPIFDVAQFAEKNCREAEDYERAMKYLLSEKRKIEDWQEIESISDSIRISTGKLSIAVNHRLDFYVHVLNQELHCRTKNEYEEVKEYISATKLLLSDVPQDIASLQEKENVWEMTKMNIPSIEGLAVSCEKKIGLILRSQNSEDLRVKKKEMKLMRSSIWFKLKHEIIGYGVYLEKSKTKARLDAKEEIMHLNNDIITLRERWEIFCTKNDEYESNDELLSEFSKFRSEGERLMAKQNELNTFCEYLGIKSADLSLFHTLYSDIVGQADKCEMITEFNHDRTLMIEVKWKSLRPNRLEGFINSWKSRLLCLEVPGISQKILKGLHIFESVLSVLSQCCGDVYNDEHWAELFYGILGIPAHISMDEVTVNEVINNSSEKILVPNTLLSLKNLSNRAMEEVTLKESLDDVITWFRSTSLMCSPNNHRRGSTPLIVDYLIQSSAISDQLDTIASLKASAYFKSILELSSIYEKKLILLNDVFSKLFEVQKRWVYLERIFKSGEILLQTNNFDNIDSCFQKIMKRNESGLLQHLIDDQRNPNIMEVLDTVLEEIENCQRNLSSFIEGKRNLFPRLNFIGDASVIELLGSSKDPDSIQIHLKHLFQGIYSAVFDNSFTSITAFRSIYNEEVKLSKVIAIKDTLVENWLIALCEEQKGTLLYNLSKRLEVDYASSHTIFPSQITCLGERIRFTKRVETVLDAHGKTLLDLREELCERIQDQAGSASTDLSMLERCNQRALILQTIHQRDIVDLIIQESCGHSSSWTWQSQLRYYFNNSSCWVKMGDATFEYSFEYQGNGETLVHTELTEKCYFNLTQAMRFGFGGNPFGPAGTGKTETVKSLGSLLGRQVLVFNCDEGLNYHTLGRIFIGLLMSGAWGCFDEFNRLNERDMSAIADLIQLIQQALKTNEKNLFIMEKTFPVNSCAALFITLNPSGKGYEGRSQLPSNLKALFRPIAMGFPDKKRIAEVSLLSDGFTCAKILSEKLIQVFEIAEKSLSYQHHYDWGLRSIKAVMRTAGRIRRSMSRERSFAVEKNIIGTSIKDTVTTSLVKRDISIFYDLVHDIFGNLEYISVQHDEMKIRKCLELEDKHSEDFINKLIQLMQALQQRTGCIILGEVGSGKSLLWKELKRVMQKCNLPVHSYAFNPKALQHSDLLGRMKEDTGEWSDGLLTSLVRKALLQRNNEITWLICDGEIDPEWIESLNSVLDDNKLLTLPTGERLYISSDIKFIFETRDLVFASPATISRNAIICMNKISSISPPTKSTELEQFKKWVEHSQNFILVGKDGSGRDTLLQEIFAQKLDIQVEIVECFRNTSPQDLLQIFEECCSLSSSLEGKIYHPSGGRRMVVVLKNIENLKCDKFGHSALLSFLHHLLDYGGLYDASNTFIQVEGVQIILVSNSIDLFTKQSTSVAERLKKNMIVGLIESPPKQTLIDQTSSHFMKSLGLLNIQMKEKECRQYITNLISLLEESIETVTPKTVNHIPCHILHIFIQNIMKYENLENEAMRKKCVTFESLRAAENMLLMQGHNKVESVLKKIAEKYTLLNGLDLFFSPTFGDTASLLTQDEIIQKLTSIKTLERKQLFEEELHTLSAIQHALFCGSKNLTLCGCKASGRKTLLKLACEINSIYYTRPKPTEDWSTLRFREQVQKVLFRAGVEQERICFHVEEFMLSEPDMVPLLLRVTSLRESTLGYFFDQKELQHCVHTLQGVITSERDLGRGKKILVANISNNLSVCFSKTLMCDFPKDLMRNTSIVHVRELKEESFEKLILSKCRHILQKVEASGADICNSVLQIHCSTVKEFGTSQGDFIGLIDVWSRLFEMHYNNYAEEQENLQLGLQKLNFTNASVSDLRKESELVKSDVIKAQAHADKAMSEITTEMALSTMKIDDIKRLKLIIAEKSEECKGNKDRIEMELAKIRPMLEASEQAVKGIKRGHLNEIKSFKTPPQPICDVLSAVLMLKGTTDLSWNSMKAFLSKRGMIDEIIRFDVTTILPQTINKVKSLVKKKAKSFDKMVISRVSVAAAPLASWVITNLDYVDIVTSTKPLEAKLVEMNKYLEECEHTLATHEDNLRQINERVIELKSSFASKTREAEILKEEMNIAKKRLDTANHLITQLGGEQIRWESRLVNLQEFKKKCWAHLLLQSSFIIYLSDKAEDKRREYRSLWLEILSTIQDFNLLQLFDKEQEIWKQWGLGQDALSKENAVIIASKPDKVPYIIDPDEMATSWLINYTSSINSKLLEILSAGDTKFHLKVELSIKTGKILLVKNVEEIEPYLYPLVRRELVLENSRNLVFFGMKKIHYHSDFKLFFTSRKTSISKVASSIVRVISFGIATCGVAERLLSMVVDHTRPNLERDFQNLIQKETNLTSYLAAQEKKLLKILCDAAGDLLENDTLIETLVGTRDKAIKLSQALSDICEARRQINEEYKENDEVAQLGMKLFSSLICLQNINYFYRYSLEGFEAVFDSALVTFHESMHEEGADLMKFIARFIILTFVSSISKNDRLLYFLHMIHGLKPGGWHNKRWDLFTESSLHDEKLAPTSTTEPRWLQQGLNKKPYELLQMHCPELIPDNIDSTEWEIWSQSDDCYSNFPVHYSPEDRLLLVKMLRPDNLPTAISRYCCDELGIENLIPISETLAQHWDRNIKCSTLPTLLITRDGGDPANEIQELASTENRRCSYISLGGDHWNVIDKLKTAAEKGEWICLKNLHLGTDLVHELERQIAALSNINDEFKVWLTTDESGAIPSSLIKQSFKIFYEAPAGLKECVKNTFARWEDGRHINHRRVNAYFALAWIHAIVHERQSLHSLGWKQNYDFCHDDINAARFVFEAYTESPYVIETIQYFLITCIYGGKINNVYDELVLRTYVETYFCEDILEGIREIIPGLRIDKNWDDQSYRRAFREIPTFHSAADFGLPPNSFRSLNVKIATSISSELRQIQTCSCGSMNHDGWFQDINCIAHYWENLVQDISSLIKKGFSPSTKGNIIASFLESEIQHGQRICQTVASCFNLLDDVFNGKIDENYLIFRKVRDALVEKHVPDVWSVLYSGKLDVYEWMSQVVKKINAINLFLEGGEPLRQSSINLSHFFRAETFLNMQKQKFCRENQHSMDEVSIFASFESKSSLQAPRKSSIYIQGLFLRGCLLEEKRDGSFIALPVKDSSPELARSPSIRLTFITPSEIHLSQSESISIPVYSNLNNDDVLFHVSVGCEKDSCRGWILAGLALFME